MTIYDIANEAGVSASTVSRVVNGKPGVNAQIREKVQTLLKKHHYVPNEAARGLVTSNSHLVGILVADVRTQHHIEGAYYIANELSTLGYCALILNAGSSEKSHIDGLRTLEQHKVEAAVLMGSIFQTDDVKKAISRHLPDVPVFMLNGFLDLPNVYGVLSDEEHGVEDCVQLLADTQKTNIAFLVDSPTPSSKLKTQGYVHGMAALGKKAAETWIYQDIDGSVDGGYKAMQEVMVEHPNVNGVICSLDIIACGALRAITDSGRKVPQEIGIIGIDNSIYAEICNPKLTSLDNMVFDSGVTIAHKLIDCLENRSTNHRTKLYTSIIKREST